MPLALDAVNHYMSIDPVANLARKFEEGTRFLGSLRVLEYRQYLLECMYAKTLEGGPAP